MSSSDLFTTVYHSSESSAKALSSTLTDAYAFSGSTAAAFAAPLMAGTEYGAEQEPGAATVPAAASPSPIPPPLRSPTAQTRAFEGTVNGDEESGGGGAGEPAGGVCGSSGRAPASPPSVVDRQEMSLADISQMRLEGCRTRHTPMASSLRVRGNGPVKTTLTSPLLSTMGRARSSISLPGDVVSAPTVITPAVPVWSSLMVSGRSARRHSSISSLHTNALDTSMTILEHMAHDTAIRMEALRSSQSVGSSTPSAAASLVLSKAPTPLPVTQHFARPTNGFCSADPQQYGNPISFGDSGSDQPVSLLHTAHTRTYTRTSDSPSPVNSLSESELRGAHLRPSHMARTAPQQPSSARLLGGAGEERDALECFRDPSPPPNGESGDYSGVRRALNGITGLRSPPLPPKDPADLLELLRSGASSNGGAPPSPQQPRDVSVYNHDFQQIVPLEVKEALKRNMRPICEDDEDEDDALLPDGLSVRTPPPQPQHSTPPPPLSAFTHVSATNVDGYFGGDTPSHTRNTTTGSVASARCGDTPSSFPPNGFQHAPYGAPVAPGSSPAPGTAVAATSSVGAGHSDSGPGDSRGAAPFLYSSIGEVVQSVLSNSGIGVPFQTWRFPSLGKPSATSASMRQQSLGDGEHEGEEAAAAAACPAAAAADAAAGGACAALGVMSPLTSPPHFSSSDSARQVASRASDYTSHTTRATLTSGSRQNASSEWPVELHSRLHTSGKQTALSAIIPSSSAAAVSPACDTGACGSSLSSGIDRPHHAVSVTGGSTTPSHAGAGHLFHFPVLAPNSPPPPGGTFGAVADDGYNRKLQMVYTVYERLLRPRGAGAPVVGTRCLPPPAASRAPSERNSLQAPAMAASTHSGPLSAIMNAAGGASLSASEAVSRGAFSPSMSCSGALGRSAGYYSFGTRISLSHPNRQKLPLQFVGSTSNLHTLMWSPRTAVLGSPLPVEVSGGIGSVSGPHDGASITATSSSAANARRRSFNASVLRRISANPLLQTTFFLESNLRAIREGQARRVRRSAEKASAAAATAKAAVQHHQQRQQHREDENENEHLRSRKQHRQAPAPPPQHHEVTIIECLSPPSADRTSRAAVAQLQCYTFPVDSASTTVDGTDTATRCTSAQAEDFAVSISETVPPEGLFAEAMAEAAASLTAAMTTSPTVAAGAAAVVRASPSTSSSTHRPSASAMQSSSSSMGKRTNVSLLSVQCIHDAHEELLRRRSGAHVDPTAAAKREPGNATGAPAAAAVANGGRDEAGGSVRTPPAAEAETSAAATPVAEVSGGSPPHRYYRALTEADRLVRHTHGVDEVEREVDNESLDLVVYVGMHLMGWLEVVSLLGCGSFGQVFLCKDLRICDGHFVHPSEIDGEDYEYWNCSHAYLPFSSVDAVPTHRPLVAVKVVKSVPLLEQQSVLEAEMLVLIGAQTAAPSASDAMASPGQAEPANVSVSAPPPEDARCANVAKVLADGICYGHHCIVMERYGANLYEYIAANDHLGLPMYQIRSIGAQLFSALSLIHEECHIIHADIKPENVLLTLDSCRGTLRVRDEASTASATATTSTVSTTGAATTPSPVTKAAPPAREASPMIEPPRHQQRRESGGHASGSPSPAAERSYITLRVGHGAVARHRLGMSGKRRNSNTLLDASSSQMAFVANKGQSFCHLRSSSTSNATVVEPANLPTPEPRRLQTLNQSAGMLSSAACGASMLSVGGSGAAGRSRYMLPPPAPEPRTVAMPPPAPTIPHLRVRLIDFSSSCYDAGPFYQYIQSRYYRAPEVIIGGAYNSGIDIWSTGCVLAELLLGMPLLPGCNDHHQLSLIEEMIGPVPAAMVTEGGNSNLFYVTAGSDEAARAALPHAPPAAGAPPRPFALRTREDFLQITGGEPQPYRRYFTYQTLQELVRHCPLTLEERRMSNGLQPYVPANESVAIPPDATPSPAVRSEMMKQRFLLFDLLRRLLQTDPKLRPTAAEALTHPFFTSAPRYLKTFALE